MFDGHDYWDEMYGEDILYVQSSPKTYPCFMCGGRLVHSRPCQELRDEWNKMDFGKYKGRHVRDVPSGYFEFLIRKGIKQPLDRQGWLTELQKRDDKYLSPRWEDWANAIT